MKKTMIMISILLLVSFTAATVFAWGPGGQNGKPRHGQGYNNCPGYSGQNAFSQLTEEQQKQITELRQKHIDDSYEAQSAKIEKRQQIRLLMHTSNPDRTKLVQLHTQMAELDKELAIKRLDFQLEVKKIAPDYKFGRDFGKKHGRMSARGQRNAGPGYGYAGCNNQQ